MSPAASCRCMSAEPINRAQRPDSSGTAAAPRPHTVSDRLHLSAGDRNTAIFGSFDGMTSTLGVVAGLLATRASAPKILAAAIGIAVAATIGMGAGQYLSDCNRDLRKAIVMACATLIGSVLPAVPFIFGSSTACILASLAVTVLAAAFIGRYRGYVVTYSILIVVSVITVGLSVAVA